MTDRVNPATIDPIDPNNDGDGSSVTATAGRRRLLRLAGAAAAGAAIATVGRPGEASAANGDNMVIGSTTNAATNSTGLFGQFQNVYTSAASYAMATANLSNDSQAIGFQGVSGGGVGVQGLSLDSVPLSLVGGTGVQGQGDAVGVEGFSPDGNGMYGFSGTGNGVTGFSTTGTGIVGSSTDSAGVDAQSGNYIDLRCTGTGRMWLTSFVSVGPPSTGQHFAGEVVRDQFGSFFVCVNGDGSGPGLWRKLGGIDTAGTLHNVAPFRAYDSRRAGYPVNGAMSMGTNRVVSVADAHDLATGNVTLSNQVPAGATAVAYNMTLVAPTNASGFAALMPGAASSFQVASVNWSAVGQTIANASTVPLSNDRQVKIFVGSGLAGSVHVVIDVVGFYK